MKLFQNMFVTLIKNEIFFRNIRKYKMWEGGGVQIAFKIAYILNGRPLRVLRGVGVGSSSVVKF